MKLKPNTKQQMRLAEKHSAPLKVALAFWKKHFEKTLGEPTAYIFDAETEKTGDEVNDIQLSSYGRGKILGLDLLFDNDGHYLKYVWGPRDYEHVRCKKPQFIIGDHMLKPEIALELFSKLPKREVHVATDPCEMLPESWVEVMAKLREQI